MIDRPTQEGRSTRSAAGRFAAVGLTATVVDIGVAVFLVEQGVDRVLADPIALALAAVVSLRLHGQVTLRGDTLDRWIRQPPVFFTAALIAGLIDLAIFVSLSGLATFWAKAVAVAGAAVIRAIFHRAVLFRAVRREQSSPVDRGVAPGVPRLSVVIPAYREERRIAATIATVRSELSSLHDVGDLEIVVVDDGSADRTADVAREGGADQVVVQPRNRGKGAAVRAGVEVSTGRTVAFTDADLAYAPHQLLETVEAGFDVVIGNRHHEDTETLEGTSALRSFGSRVVNMATNVLLLGNYRDTQCGCKAFRSDAARAVFGASRIDGFAFDIELLHLVERYGLSMCELPVEVVNSETSTVSAVRDGIRVMADILRIRWAARRGRYPDLGSDALPSPGVPPTGGLDDLPSGGK